MPQIQASVTINRPITEVFRFATDFNKAPEWQPDVKEVHQSEERPRVGVMVSVRRSTYLLGTRLDLNADITNYSMNRLMEYKGVIGRYPAVGVLKFESQGGSTVVTESIDIRMGCLFAPLSPLMNMVMSTRTRRMLGNLKKVIEGRSAASSSVTNFQSEL
jgi:uncharacterized membrane protein